MYLVIEQDMRPIFTKFNEERNAVVYLKQQGYKDFEKFEDSDGIEWSRSEIDYNTAFIVKIN